MCKDEKKRYWQDLIRGIKHSVEAFETPKLRELVVFGTFLSWLGIDFIEDDIIQPKDDPPDIIFQNHEFEITFSTGNRKPHKEAKEELQKVIEQKDKQDVSYIDFKNPEKILFSNLIDEIENVLNKKNNEYSSKDRLNIIVYIMQDKFPNLDSPFPDLWKLIAQGWRSVTVIINQYIVVLYAKDLAPQFIKNIVQTPKLSPSLRWWTPKCWQKI